MKQDVRMHEVKQRGLLDAGQQVMAYESTQVATQGEVKRKSNEAVYSDAASSFYQ